MKKILIVEDDMFLSKIYKEGLISYGYDVILSHNGMEALEILKSSKPDLIILDLIMPKLNGMDTLKKIKSDKNLKNIPVIVASNLGQSSDISNATKAGAVHYVVKTDISIKELTDKIDSFLNPNKAQ